MNARRVIVGSLVAALSAAASELALGGPTSDHAATARPVVLAAASLTEVLPRIVPEASYSFGSSN